MRPVSERFLETLTGSHRAATQAFVVAPGQTGVNPTGTEIPIADGDVLLDANTDIRSSLNLTTDGTGLFPDNSEDDFTPYGNEIFVRRGIAFSGGSLEYVSLGYFRIQSIEQEQGPDGPILITAHDRMAGIVDGRLLAPVQFSAIDTYGEVVEDLVLEVYPWATIEWDDSTDTDPIGRSLIAEQERFQFLNELVTSLGKIWFWDYRGVLVIKDPPDAEDSVWTVNAGRYGVLARLSRELSREGVHNAVVAYGEAIDENEPPRAVAVDNNPDSPTYFSGPFGPAPRYYSSPFITTEAQAQSAANSLLRQDLGLPYVVDFETVPNPALEPWDPITLTYQNRTEMHMIERLTIPFTGTMSAQTKQQTLVIIGED